MSEMNIGLPMCSVCEADLECTGFWFDECDGEYVWFKSCGYCPECGREYYWYEKYNLAGVSEPVCIGEREQWVI